MCILIFLIYELWAWFFGKIQTKMSLRSAGDRFR